MTTNSRPSSAKGDGPAPLEVPDIAELGGIKDGERQRLDRRLYVQLQVFTECLALDAAVEAVIDSGLPAAVYEDLNDSRGFGVVTFSEDPADFLDDFRSVVTRTPFDAYRPRPEMTMLGRTYALGYEPDLEEALIHRPRRYVLNPDWPWAIWYPLRRSGAFAALPEPERRAILKEHGTIGKTYGRADLVHDVRLASFGLDTHDNDFVIGLIGSELYPLSHVVETMRGTRQTSEYIERLGPFFVGRAVFQSADPGDVAAGGKGRAQSFADRVLATFVDEDRLTRIPASRKKRDVILKWLVKRFETDRRYAESEVNAVIETVHPDYATLRRELVGTRLMARANGTYWRTPDARRPGSDAQTQETG